MAKKKPHRNIRIVKYIMYRETLVDVKEHIWTFLGAFTGIALIGLLNSRYVSVSDNLFLVGPFGASSVLIYGVINSPLAQPRNLIGGHLLSAFTGVCFYKLFPQDLWLAAALSVSTAIVLMQITKTLHPPGGASAIIACIGSEKIKALGFWFVINPILCGVLILFTVALIFNNIGKTRKYPANWNLKKKNFWK
ncbi:MAG: HPP family protein [Bacteroidia bacterium]